MISDSLKHFIASCTASPSPEQDEQLWRLALQTAKIARSDAIQAFEWAKMGEMQKALDKLKPWDEAEFYKASLLLLWIEMDRQKALAVEKRSRGNIGLLVQEVKKRGLNWAFLVEDSFIQEWAYRMMDIASAEDVAKIVEKGRDNADYILRGVAFRLADEGKIEKAAEFLHCMHDKHRSYILSRLAWVFSRAGEAEKSIESFQKAIEAARKIEEDESKLEALSEILRSPSQYRDLPEKANIFYQILETAKDTKNENSIPSSFFHNLCNAVRAAQKLQRDSSKIEGLPWKSPKCTEYRKIEIFQQILEIAQNIKDTCYKSDAFFLIAESLVEVGEFREAIKILRQTESNHWKDNVSEIAKILAQMGDFSEALKTAREIPNSNFKSEALAGIAEVLSQTGNFPEKSEIFHNLVAAAEEMEDESCKFMSFFMIAKSLAQTGDYEQAFQVAQKIEDSCSQSKALSEIAQIFAHAGNFSQAAFLFQKVLTNARRIAKNSDKSDALSKMARYLAQTGNFPERSDLFQQAITEARKVSCAFSKSLALLEIAHALVQTGAGEKSKQACDLVLEAAQNIEDEQCKILILSGIALVLAQRGDLSESADLFQKLLERVRNIKHLRKFQYSLDRCKSELLTTIASAFVQTGNITRRADFFRQILEINQNIKDSHAKSDLLLEIMRYLIGMDDLPEKPTLFQQALEIARSADNKYYVFSGVAEALALAGKNEEAKQALQRYFECPPKTEEYLQSKLLYQIAHELLRAGEKDKARQVLKQSFVSLQGIAEYQKSQAVRAITRIFDQTDPFSEEIAFLQEIVSSITDIGRYCKSEILFVLVRAFCKLGDFQQAFSCAEKTEDDIHKTNTLSDIAQFLAHAKDFPQRAEFFQQILSYSRTIKTYFFDRYHHGRSQSNVLSGIAKALILSENLPEKDMLFDKTLDAARNLQVYFPYSKFISDIARTLAQTGNFDEAMEAAQHIEEGEYKTGALAGIAQALVRSGDEEKGNQMFQQALETAKNIQDSRSEQHEALLAIVQAFVRAGKLDEAIAIAKNTMYSHQKSDALEEIIVALVQAGDFEKALATAQNMYPSDISRGLAHIAEGLGKARDFADRFAFYNRILEIVQHVEDAWDKTLILSGMARGLTRPEDFALFSSILEKLYLPAENICWVVQTWRETIVEHFPDPLPYLRQTLAVYPFDYSLAYHGVAMIQIAHIKQKHWEHIEAIV